LTEWQQQWQLLTAAIAVVVDGGGGGIEPTMPMVASSTVVAVDGGGNNGIFTNASHDNDHHPCPHRPRPLLDENRTAGWRARCDASHSLSPRSLSAIHRVSLTQSPVLVTTGATTACNTSKFS
jgi:hypothetical protein